MKKNLLLILCIVLTGSAFAQVITPFTTRYQTTQKGGITFVSGSAVTCSGIGCGAGRVEVPPSGTSTNNGFTIAYVDSDADGTTFMSSSDSLYLASCSDILFAGLYWGGEMNNTGANYATRNQVKLKVNNGSYQSLTADNLQDNAVGYDSYHCFKDVTSLIKAGGINSRITVADVAVRVGGTNRWGGWSIVVVYKNDLQPMRTLSVFNGLSNVSGANPITDVTISGFLTPLSGPITFEIGAISYDGDRSSTGDQVMFNGGSGFVNVSDAVNPLNDVFNSTISRNGVNTPFRNPSYTNTLGYDADIFIPNNAAKNYIGNSATSATIRFSTGGETYLTQVVTAAIDVYEPDLRAFVRSVDLNGGSIVPGDIIEYTVTGKNVGSDPSVNTYLENVLEQNLVYVPGSMSVTYGPNAGVKTDAAGDDQAEYIAAQRKVRARIGTGANAVSGGQVNNSTLGVDSTQFKFRAMATTDCIVLLCDNVINNSVNIYGTGNVSGNSFVGTSLSGATDGSGCFIPGSTNNTIVASCITPTASSNSPVCTGSTISLTSSPSSSSATYAWTGPGGFVSTAANPNRANATAAMAGTYTVVISTGACSYTATTTVVINIRPATPAPSSNSPVCTGNTINLSTAAVAGATYSWTGPSAFASALQNPTRLSAVVTMAGTYSVTVTANSCTSAVGTVVVIVNTTPATPAPSSNSPVCTGNTINLSTPAVAGATYSWTGPNSFASSVQNPSIIAATTAMAGTYSVAVTTNGCTSAVGTVVVVVNSTPVTPAPSSNSPVCTGNTINLSTAAVAGATYSWTGPNSFASSVQNPSISAVTTAMAGTYSVAVTVNGCTSAVGTTAVVVNSTPVTPAPSSNSPVCTGNTINLSTPAVAGATYSWTGPNSFVSSVQNPSISAVTTAMAGTYSVAVTVNGCTSAVGTIAVVVNTTPSTPAPSSNSPVCTGNTINLSTPAVAGATYSWTGPNSFASSVQNPSLVAATTAMAGTYSVAVTVNGCTSAVGTTAVVVNTTPSTPAPSSNSPVCTGNMINLSTPAVAGATYSWTGPNSFASSVQNPSISAATTAMAGTYSVAVTVNGCTSAVGTVAVVVNTTPSTPAPSSNSPVCTGNTINLSTPAVAGATYSWTGPNSFASSVQNPSISAVTTAMAGTYSVAVTANGCTSAVGTTAVVVNTTPVTPAPSSNSPVCTGNTINLSTAAVAGATYSWTGPSSFSSSVQNPSIVAVITAMAGTYSVAVTVNGCTSAVGTTTVVVNSTPVTPAPSSNSPVCTGNTINLSTAAVAGATYSWTGPNSFASSVQNPSIVAATTAMAGTYSVAVTVNGCTSAVGTVAVVVNTTPSTPAPSSNSPVCTGNTINLSTPAVAGATYSWTGPNSFASSVQNPSIVAVTTAMAGTYSVAVTVNGCTSAVGTTAVVVNTTPATPAPSSNSPVCTGNTINLSTAAVAGATYSWTGPNSFASSVQNPSLVAATTAMAGTYSVAVTVNGCTSAVGTVSVIIDQIIVTPVSQTNVSCNSGTNGAASVTASGGIGTLNYTWTPTGGNAANASGLNAGTYTVTVSDANGCTSAQTFVITEPTALVASSNSTPIGCNGGTSSITVSATGGTPNYTGTGTHTVTAGTYTYVVSDANGCTSSTTITVSEPSIISGSQTFVECQGFSVTVGSNTYTATGIYTDVLMAANGCDSTVTTDLTIKLPSAFTQTFVECQGFSVIVGSNTYTATGVYTDVLMAANGCDSTVTTDLTIKQPSVFTQTFVECQGFSVIVGSNTYTATGVYTDVLMAVNGCDSTVTTDLTIQNAIDNTVTSNGITITANAAGLAYQWIDCDNGNSIIAGETNQSYTASVSGNYAVIITSGSCSATSACETILITGLQNLKADNSIRVFPNPFNDVISITCANTLNTPTQIEIFNAIGQKVHSEEMIGNTLSINLEKLDTGIYFIKMTNNKNESITKLIKQ